MSTILKIRGHYLYTITSASSGAPVFICACGGRFDGLTWEEAYDAMATHLEVVRDAETIVDGAAVTVVQEDHPRDGETGVVVCAGQTSAHVKFKDSVDSLCFPLAWLVRC